MSVEATRKRLTREESRAQTLDRLLDAARALFIEKGIEATSIEEVTESAGYSRGAFYSNFESKEQLVCTLLERETKRSKAELTALYSLPVSPEERLGLVRAHYVELSSKPQNCMFWMAMQLYAIRDPASHSRIVELLREDRAQVAEFVKLTFAELGKQPPIAPELVAFGLIAQAQGLALAIKIHPNELTADQLGECVGHYFDRIVE